VDGVKVVVEIKEKEAVSGCMGRQNIGAEGNRTKRRCHLGPIFAMAGTGWRTGERELTMRANVGGGCQKRAVGDVLGRKGTQTLALPVGLRNDELDRSGGQANRHIVVVPEIDVNGDDASGVERILSENFFAVARSPDIGVGDDGQVLMRVAGAQRHGVGRRALAQRAKREEDRDSKNCAEHSLVGYDAPSR